MARIIAKQRQRHPDKAGITHTSYALYYHLVWDTAERHALINADLRSFLSDFILHKCQELDVRVLAIGINPDHIHLILSLKPSHYIPDIVQALKGGSAYAVNHASPSLGTIRWNRGYSIRTVSERNLDVAKAYVNNQAAHHGYEIISSPKRLKEGGVEYDF
jgi:REP element-mobilizing transposase RayT